MKKKGVEVGYPTGFRCVDMGSKENHKTCLANKALAGQTSTRLVAFSDFAGTVLDTYWIPLSGSDELYVYYGADITEWAAERLLPKYCASAADCAACSCG